MDSHVLYLTSAANKDLYPNNNPSSFENRLYNNITLDPNRSYEIGLQKLLLPSAYYVIMKNDLESYIRVRLECTDSTQSSMWYKHIAFPLENNILAGDLKEIISAINREIVRGFNTGEMSFIGKAYQKKYPKRSPIYIRYDPIANRIAFNATYGKLEDMFYEGIKHPIVTAIGLSFGLNIGAALGTVPAVYYYIYTIKEQYNHHQITPQTPPIPCGMLDYFCVYCDKVVPTRYGNQLVNILDVISPNPNERSNKLTYKPLNTNVLDSLSIQVTDQNGSLINYDERGSAVAVIHIRPRTI